MAGLSRFFRAGEFPRWLVLAAIMVVGWSFWFTAPEPQPEPPRATAGETPPLPPADAAPIFAGVTDRTPIKLGDTAAYAALLERARTIPPSQLAARSRRDVIFSQLLDRPGRYRGLPIHLQGTAKRILVLDDIAPGTSPAGRLYEAWTFTDDSQGFPYVLIFEDAPKALPVGDNVSELIAFNGYFFKLLAYRAADGPRVAPLLIGRIGWRPRETAAPAPVLGLPRDALRAVVAVLFLLTTLRLLSWASRTRRALTRPGGPTRVPAPIDPIDPAELSDWLARAAQAEPGPAPAGPGADDSSPHHDPGPTTRPRL